MTGTDVLTLFSPEAGAAKSQPAGNGSYAGQTAWGGWGSNPRPADYESATAPRFSVQVGLYMQLSRTA
jgi:hypothetical protein